MTHKRLFKSIRHDMIEIDDTHSAIKHLSEMEVTLIGEIEKVSKNENLDNLGVKFRMEKAQCRLNLVQAALKELHKQLKRLEQKLKEFLTA